MLNCQILSCTMQCHLHSSSPSWCFVVNSVLPDCRLLSATESWVYFWNGFYLVYRGTVIYKQIHYYFSVLNYQKLSRYCTYKFKIVWFIHTKHFNNMLTILLIRMLWRITFSLGVRILSIYISPFLCLGRWSFREFSRFVMETFNLLPEINWLSAECESINKDVYIFISINTFHSCEIRKVSNNVSYTFKKTLQPCNNVDNHKIHQLVDLL